MIGALKGIVTAIGDDRAIIDVGGVGYLIMAGARTLGRLVIGQPAHVFVETIVREDSFRLYGFGQDLERAWFVRLQDVTGVGARVALALLDTLGPDALLEAVALEDKASVARTSGVGPKLAQRLITELKDTAPPQPLFGPRQSAPDGAFTNPSQAPGTEDTRREGLSDMSLRNEAISALVNLGIGQPDALRAVAAAYRSFEDDPDVGTLVKAALKEASR